jgi:hypothetical protein
VRKESERSDGEMTKNQDRESDDVKITCNNNLNSSAEDLDPSHPEELRNVGLITFENKRIPSWEMELTSPHNISGILSLVVENGLEKMAKDEIND